MIHVEQIASAEAQHLKEEGITSYWALPLGMTLIFLVLRWQLERPWGDFIWLSGGIWFLCIRIRLLWYKPSVFTVKIIRRGKVIHAAYLGNNPMSKLNIEQHIDITLEAETIPEPYHSMHTFTVWKTTGTTYFKQESWLRHRYKELIGKEVELEYLPENGLVIACRLLSNLEPELT